MRFNQGYTKKVKKMVKQNKRVKSAYHKKATYTTWKDDTLKEIITCLDLIDEVMEELKDLDPKIK